jgi:hypothetical protein
MIRPIAAVVGVALLSLNLAGCCCGNRGYNPCCVNPAPAPAYAGNSYYDSGVAATAQSPTVAAQPAPLTPPQKPTTTR